jgi:hypothetical protein
VAAKVADYPVIARSKELLMRWMELNAFLRCRRHIPTKSKMKCARPMSFDQGSYCSGQETLAGS